MKTSQEWVTHFAENLTKKRVNWQQKPKISDQEKAAILYSLKAWQKGETSEGTHLMAAARKYSDKIDDREYCEAIRLFIKEEQKHGANLGRYIDKIGEKRLEADLGDFLFRRIRYFNTSMEAWTITVIIVESAAQIFYRALKNATACPLLQEICTDILIDEAYHIDFQKERLVRLFQDKSFTRLHLSLSAYTIFFKAVVKTIWLGHGKAFKAGGIDKYKFETLMRFKITKIFNAIRMVNVLNADKTNRKMVWG